MIADCVTRFDITEIGHQYEMKSLIVEAVKTTEKRPFTYKGKQPAQDRERER